MENNKEKKGRGILTKRGIAALLLSIVISTGTGCSSNNGFKNVPSSRIPISCSECSNSKYYKINDLKSYLKQFFSKRMTEEMSSTIDLISNNLESLLGGNSLYVIKENYIVENMLVFYEGNDTTINEDYTLTISPLEDGYDIRYVDNDKYHTVYSYSIDYKDGVRVTRTTEDNGVTLISTINEYVQLNKIDFSTGAHKILFNSNGKKLMLELNGGFVIFAKMDANNNITDKYAVYINQDIYNQMQLAISTAFDNESISSFAKNNRKLIFDLLEEIKYTSYRDYEKFYFDFFIHATDNSYAKRNVEYGIGSSGSSIKCYIEIDAAKFIEEYCLIVDESQRTYISNTLIYLKDKKVYLEKEILDDIIINGIASLLKREYFELRVDRHDFVRINSSKYSQNENKTEETSENKWYDESISIFERDLQYYPVKDLDKMLESFIGKECINDPKIQERISFLKKELEKCGNVFVWGPFNQNFQEQTDEKQDEIRITPLIISANIDQNNFSYLCITLDKNNNFSFNINYSLKDAYWDSIEHIAGCSAESQYTGSSRKKDAVEYKYEFIDSNIKMRTIEFIDSNSQYEIKLTDWGESPFGETNYLWRYSIKFYYKDAESRFNVASEMAISKEEYERLVSIIREYKNNIENMIRDNKELFIGLLERTRKNGIDVVKYASGQINNLEEVLSLLIDGLEEAAIDKENKPYMKEKKLDSIK